jgi:hypothetical protein
MHPGEAEMSTEAEEVSAVFTCHLCGAVAATVTVTGEGTMQQAGFLGVMTQGIDPAAYREIAKALWAGDAAHLHRLHVLWAPFYCPDCRKVYCRDHWRIFPPFDSDFPGWYDCAYGTCPEGHRHLVDD